MTNGCKYTNAAERETAFSKWCKAQSRLACDGVKSCTYCIFAWLDRKTEEELNCIWCNSKDVKVVEEDGGYRIECPTCGARTYNWHDKEFLLRDYNTVVRVLKEQKVTNGLHRNK